MKIHFRKGCNKNGTQNSTDALTQQYYSYIPQILPSENAMRFGINQLGTRYLHQNPIIIMPQHRSSTSVLLQRFFSYSNLSICLRKGIQVFTFPYSPIAGNSSANPNVLQLDSTSNFSSFFENKICGNCHFRCRMGIRIMNNYI